MSSAAHTTPPDAAHPGSREIEWQLGSPNLASVRRWLAEHPAMDGLLIEPASTLRLSDTYFDTVDWRIHRAGFALRIRTESGQAQATLKSLQPAHRELADRRELSETLQDGAADKVQTSSGPVGSRVSAVTGSQALRPLFEVRTNRERFAVRR